MPHAVIPLRYCVWVGFQTTAIKRISQCRVNFFSPPRCINQSVLKEINPKDSLEGLMLKLTL